MTKNIEGVRVPSATTNDKKTRSRIEVNQTTVEYSSDLKF